MAQPSAPSRSYESYGRAIAASPFRVLPQMAAEAGKDVLALGTSMAAAQNPGTMVDLAVRRPETVRRGAAAAVGTGLGFLGGPATGAAARMGAGPLLARILGGGVGGAAAGAGDAAIRTGDPRAAALGGALGGVLGGGAGALTRNLRTPEPGDPRPYNPLRSVEERLKGAGEPGEEIVKRVRAADTEGSIRAGQFEAQMAEARPLSILDRLLPGRRKQIGAEEDRIGDALRGVIDPASLSERERRLYDVIHRYRGTPGSPESPVGRARAAGLDVGEQQNYFPQNALTTKELRQPIGKQSMAASVRAGRFPTMEAAQAHADDYIKWVESGGREGGVLQGDEATKNLLLKMARNPKSDSFANLELARETNHPFFDPSPTRAFRRYAEGAERRIAEAREWGPDSETLKGLIGSIQDPRLQEQVKRLTTVATGNIEEMGPSAGSRLLAGSRRLATFKLSPTSSIRNLSQSMNSLLASDPTSFAQGIARSLTKRGRMLPVENGALTDEATHQVHRMMAGGSQGLEGYLRGIGFSGTERVNRTVAANVGWSYAQKVARALKANPKSEFLRGELRALELDPDAIVAQGGLSARDLLAATKVFVDRTQFKQRPLDVPAMFTESLIGRNLLQFKGFTAQQGRLLAQETIDRLASGNARNMARGARNIALLATAFPLTGEATNDIVAAMQGKKRTSKGLARWYENLVYAGGLGLFSDAIESLKYGSLAYLAGPSLGTVTDIADIGIRATKRGIERSSKPRKKGDTKPAFYLTRGEGKQLFRQIPVAGPLLTRRLFPDEESEKARKRKEEKR